MVMKRWKAMCSMVLASVLISGTLVGCGGKTKDTSAGGEKDKGKDSQVEITWWNYPNFSVMDGEVGKYEKEIVKAFNKKYPDIKVKVEMLSYNGGPEKVNAAIASKSQPDMIYDYPGRIIDYGKQGLLADFNDMMDSKFQSEVPKTILDACKVGDKYYMYPFNTADFVVAFNKTMFEKAGIVDKLPLNNPDRLWSTEEFTEALKAVKEKVPGVAPMVFYCKSNQGDQGTRAFIANLYGGDVINNEGTEYQLNKEGPVKAMQWVVDGIKSGIVLKGGESLTSNDAIDLFLQQKAACTILYSTVLKNINASKKVGEFQEVLLPLPTPKGQKPKLEAYIGGMGIFNNGDPKKVEAAKKLVDFIANDAEWGKKNLVSTGGLSVKKSVTGIYNDPEMKFAESLIKYTGKYYNTVDGFTEMRTYWFPEMQNITLGKVTPKQGLDNFVTKANATLKKK